MGATRKSSCRWKKQDWNPSLSAWPQRILIADKSAAWWQPFPTASNLQGPVDCHFFQSAWERWPWRKHQAFWKDSMGQSLRSSFLNYLELSWTHFCMFFVSYLWHSKRLSSLEYQNQQRCSSTCLPELHLALPDFWLSTWQWSLKEPTPAFKGSLKWSKWSECLHLEEVWTCQNRYNTTGMLWCFVATTHPLSEAKCPMASCWISSLRFRFLAPLWSCHCEHKSHVARWIKSDKNSTWD